VRMTIPTRLVPSLNINKGSTNLGYSGQCFDLNFLFLNDDREYQMSSEKFRCSLLENIHSFIRLPVFELSEIGLSLVSRVATSE
jgi:hypothetical protein